ncbi:ANTAR domain-containing response regulator [Pelomicrobium methylotrophicum]|uniref:ANTAR domain-containing protein n=1 Tax=Pelomicrobium methylotrophicum TaxID=2602750 RepID=A0A5C7EXB1_9PROT|nr:ANTAR domain-containing protein [Pelomicrobium methylotrophicum]TXF13043.1 ANTAR domain-containing protein [Pelomicrobium methylotrophicum]
MRVILVDDTARDVGLLKEALTAVGCEVAAQARSAFELHELVLKLKPDVVIVDADSPSRDVLEQLCAVTRATPRPIVLFTADRSAQTIEAAIRAGVSAYVVDGIDPARIDSILRVAIARFEADQALRRALAEAQARLDERKVVERAKGLIMKARGVDEEEAYRLLRKMAMDRKMRLADVARDVIDIMKRLG